MEFPLLSATASYAIPSALDASAVPSTRDLIFPNAVSRLVEVSSQNGEKPQSSVLPSCR